VADGDKLASAKWDNENGSSNLSFQATPGSSTYGGKIFSIHLGLLFKCGNLSKLQLNTRGIHIKHLEHS